MKMDLSAVPRLTLVEVIPGDGDGQDEFAWARSINTLRVRFDTLSYRELCTLLRQSYIGDLCCLVISTPYNHAMLQKLREGLSEAAWEMLEKDCVTCGDSLLAANGFHVK